jgi:hypothetical protein
MRIRHPISFGLMLVIIVMTAAVAVVWSLTHLVALAVDIVAIIGLRWVAHREASA